MPCDKMVDHWTSFCKTGIDNGWKPTSVTLLQKEFDVE